ncbi:MAG: hypothetical protein JXB39_08205 [Deltaproteobacteria bacterium]|nr:hypothetical protein [Deltaproteobacteria bacterium]
MIKEPARSRKTRPCTPPDPSLVEAVARVRHDLGKYVAMELRWLPPDPDPEAVRAALRADVGATRRQGDRLESAPALWDRLRPSLAGLADDPDVAAVDAAMEGLRALLPDLDHAPADRLAKGAAAAMEVAHALKRLDQRVREAATSARRLKEARWPASS